MKWGFGSQSRPRFVAGHRAGGASRGVVSSRQGLRVADARRLRPEAVCMFVLRCCVPCQWTWWRQTGAATRTRAFRSV